MKFSIYILKKFSVKKGTLPLRWVSSPGPFDCRLNALSSELRRFHTTFFTESIYANDVNSKSQVDKVNMVEFGYILLIVDIID